MGAWRITHSKDNEGVVLHDDTFLGFIAEARRAAAGDKDAIRALPDSALYVANQLAHLIEPDLEAQRARQREETLNRAAPPPSGW